MKITITLDDVIRAKSKQFAKIYKKYIQQDLDLDTIDFSSGNLEKIFKFKSKKEYLKFLYEDYVFEIFAEAIPCDKMLDKKLNLWLLDLENDENVTEELEFTLSNTMEYNASIGYTYFFISKIATRIRNVFLPTDSNDIWEKSDIVITADPKLLENKPEGKKVVKIETDYNKNYNADLTYSKLLDVFEDKDFLNKLTKKE